MLRVELAAMAPHRNNRRLGFEDLESGRWEVLVENGIAVEEENKRSCSPFPAGVAGARGSLGSFLKNDDLSAEIGCQLCTPIRRGRINVDQFDILIGYGYRL